MTTYEIYTPRFSSNDYADLRGYFLEGTNYHWDFKISPTCGNLFEVTIYLKRKGIFQKTLMKKKSIVDKNRDDIVKIIKQAMNMMISTEYVRSIVFNEKNKCSSSH